MSLEKEHNQCFCTRVIELPNNSYIASKKYFKFRFEIGYVKCPRNFKISNKITYVQCEGLS